MLKWQFLRVFNERQPWARNFSLGCFLLSALVCFLSVWERFHPDRMRVLSCSALSSGTSIHHVVFILSSLPRNRSMSNGVVYFNSIFVWLVLLLWKSFLRQEKEFWGGLMHQCTAVKAGRIKACILRLGRMGVNFLLSFADDSTALCLPSRTSAFCPGKL